METEKVLRETVGFLLAMRQKRLFWDDLSPAYVSKMMEVPAQKVRNHFRIAQKNDLVKLETKICLDTIGYKTYMAYLWSSPTKIIGIFDKVAKLPGVVEGFLVMGEEFQIVLRLKMRESDADLFTRSLTEKVGDDLDAMQINNVTEIIGDGYSLGTGPTGDPIKLDQTDKTIIHMLRSRGSATYREISDKVGISAPSVFARVKKLRGKQVICGYMIRLTNEADKYGESYRRLTYRPCWLRVKPSQLKEIQALLRGYESENEKIAYAYAISEGPFNIAIGILAHKPEDLPPLIRTILDKFEVSRIDMPQLARIYEGDLPL